MSNIEPLPEQGYALDPLPPPSHTPAHSDTKAVAKDEVGAVAQQAKSDGKHVAEEAKLQGQEVVQEARRQVSSLVGQAQGVLTEQAGTQKDRAAVGVRTLSDEFVALANGNSESGLAVDLAHSAGQKLDEVASWLETRDHNALLSDVQRYARRNPGTFLLLAAGAGMLAGRLTRGLRDANSADTSANAGVRPGSSQNPAAGFVARPATPYVAPEETLATPTGQPVPPAPGVTRDHA